MKLLGKRVLVEVAKIVETSSGIMLTQIEEEDKNRGTVVEIGTEVTDVAVGDEIMFNVHAGKSIVVEEKDLKLMREEDIYGIITYTED